MKKTMMLTLALITFSSLASFADDDSQIYIKVGEANVKKSLLALPPFLFLSSPALASSQKELGAELYNTIQNDLDVSNLFTIIKQSAYLEDPAKIGLTPAPGNSIGFHFESWSKIGADFLIRGGYKVQGGDMEFEVYVYYIPQAKLVLGKKYLAKTKDVRQTAHSFSDDLMKALTGKKGFFRTKFVVASDRGGKKWKEIYVMDWDGRNTTQISTHRSVALSPTWHPNGKTVAYTAFAYHPNFKFHNPDLFTYDIFTGKRFLVSSRKGINSGAAYSPDGKSIYLTMTNNDDADIWRMDDEGENLSPVTKGPKGSINVEPAASPDGKKIAFSSDRSGHPMIYVMDIDGANPKRVTFAGRYNSSPAWSPDGTKIAFAGQDKDHYDIFIMDADGSDMQRLTSAKKTNGKWASHEHPSFSPDGRYVVFTSNRTGKEQIFIVSIDGTSERRITVDSNNYYKPKWSPYID